MKTFTKSAIAAVLVMSSTAAMAEISGNVALTSNYVFRGLTQTMNDGAIQGGFDYGHESGFYAGVWASNVDFAPSTLEVDIYAGYAGDMGNGISYDVGILRYNYDDDTAADTNEMYIGLGFDASDTISVSVNYAYSSDFFSGGSAHYLSAGLDVALSDAMSASVSVGKSDGEALGNDDYVDYNLGLSTSFEGIDIGVNYTGTNKNKTQAGNTGDDKGRFFITLSKSL